MGVTIDSIHCRFWPRLSAPRVGIRYKEHLLLRETLKAREKLFRLVCIHLLPRREGSIQSSCIRNVLSQSKSSIDMQWLAIWVGHSKIVVLIDEALSLVLKRVDSLVVPPVREVADLIVMSSSGVKSFRRY